METKLQQCNEGRIEKDENFKLENLVFKKEEVLKEKNKGL